MTEEKERILRMVREGKISKEEGDELLSALEEISEEGAVISKEKELEEKPSPPTGQPQVAREIPPSRSVGVMIAGCLLLLLSLGWLFGGPWGLVFHNPLYILKFNQAHLALTSMVGETTFYNSIYTIFAIFIFIPAIGILFFKEWARKLLIGILAFHAILSVCGLVLLRVSYVVFGWPQFAFWGRLGGSAIFMWLILDIFLIWYFSRAKIRPQFS